MRDETVGAFVIEFIPWETYGMKARISGLNADGSTCGYCAASGRVCELHRDIWQRLTRLAKEPIEPEPQPEPQPEKRRRDRRRELDAPRCGYGRVTSGRNVRLRDSRTLPYEHVNRSARAFTPRGAGRGELVRRALYMRELLAFQIKNML